MKDNKSTSFLNNLSFSLKKKMAYRKKAENTLLKLKNSLKDKQVKKKLVYQFQTLKFSKT